MEHNKLCPFLSDKHLKRPSNTGLTTCINKPEHANARFPHVTTKRCASSAESHVYLTRGICLPGTPEYYKRQFMMSKSEASISGGLDDDGRLHHSKVERIQPISSKIKMGDKPPATRPCKPPPLRRRTEFERIVGEYLADLSTKRQPTPQKTTTKLPLIHYHQPKNPSMTSVKTDESPQMRMEGKKKLTSRENQEEQKLWNQQVIQQWNKHLRQQWNLQVRQQWHKRVVQERSLREKQEVNKPSKQQGNHQVMKRNQRFKLEKQQQLNEEENQRVSQEQNQGVRQAWNQQVDQVGNKPIIHQPLHAGWPVLLQRQVKQNFNLEYFKTHLRNLEGQMYKIKH